MSTRRIGKAPLPDITIDPRQYHAHPEVISEEMAATWMAGNPRCVCGCGQVPNREIHHNRRVPRGAYRLFCNGHEARMQYRKDLITNAGVPPERRERISRGQLRKHFLPSAPIMALVEPWCAERGMTLIDFSRVCGVDSPRLYAWRGGKRSTHMRKHTAGQILAAMGVPLRKDVALAYQLWCKRNDVPMADFTVEHYWSKALGMDPAEPEPDGDTEVDQLS